MQIALAQLAGREGDIAYNLSRTLTCLRNTDAETSLIVFPETHLTGFAEPGHVEDRALALEGPELNALVTASREQETALAVGFLERAGDDIFNTTVLITPEDGIALRYRKTHLWPDERQLVGAGDRVGCIEWRGLQVGLLICYDLEFPEPARALGQLGCDLLLVTNGNMDPYGPVHARAAQARAQDNHYFLAMTNRAGEGAGLTFAGESALVAPDGEMLFRADREESVTTLQLDLQRLPAARRDYDYQQDCRIGLQGRREDSGRGRYWHF